ncbi:MAG: hypothetical protein HQ492_02900, partial [Woeseiaceae bacterium]|nr:hypothetical protein [Woeseiaceae bacterium]
MVFVNQSKVVMLLASALTISACSSGGADTSPTVPVNRAPIAVAGADQSVDELAAVNIDGSASSDPDAGTTLTYAWTQTAGANVVIANSDMAQASFDAPDVTALNTPATLTFRLTVSDGTASAMDTVDVVVADVGLGINSPPTADAGPDQTVSELATVDLDGSGSMDPDGNVFSYAWTQTSGQNVALSGANTATPSFTSPDVAAATPEVLTFQLTVDDSSDSTMDTVDIRVQEGLSQVNVAGIVRYETVPPRRNGSNSTCFGLDFGAITPMPIRAATVQLLDSSNTILGTTVSGMDGSYSFSNIEANTDVHIRVRAELKRSGFPNWDVDIRDNVDTSATPPALGVRPLYVFDSSTRNTGVAHINDFDVTATTGWGGASYTGTRVAAPFAILDAIYTGMQLILSVDATASFPALDAFWSVNNTQTDGSDTDIDLGELGGSFYVSGVSQLFLTGDELVDTGEFDSGVTLHEWGHYFEDKFSRSDNIGGTHFLGELVEARVSFGEGWGSAVAAMASGDPLICDSGTVSGSGSFGYNVETFNSGPQGWYNEMSVAGILFDLYDSNNDGVDNGSIGFEPIYDVMTGPQTTMEAFTTLFSFSSLLRPTLTVAGQNLLDTLLATENVETTGLDIWASSQANNGQAVNQSRDVLPLYTDYTVGSTLNICVNSDHDPDGDGNKPAESRYLRVTTLSSAIYDVTLAANPVPPPTADPPPTPPDEMRDRSDPDIYVYRNGALVAFGNSGVD